MRTLGYVILPAAIAIAILASGCKKGSPVSPDSGIPSSNYVVHPPPGKLPWPQHDPQFSQTEYDAMMDSLWIINNFGQYQGGEDSGFVYFHDGLDVVLWNGTKIFAVESGYVKSIINGGEYYQTLIIGNTPGSAPGYAWSYSHVNNFQVRVGDTVRQGEYLADIHFMGLPHVHLSRMFLESGSWSNYSDIRSVQPDNFFSYRDGEPPVIEAGFRYYRNENDSLLGTGNGSVISGPVDIVVGMREQGYYAHSKGGMVEEGFGDRLSVSRIEYDITSGSGRTFHYKSFDFSNMILGQYPDLVDRFYTVYKFYYTVHPEGPASWSKIACYYVITNTDGTGEAGEVNPSDRNYSWKTDSTSSDGTPVFPDGLYTVTVHAFDPAGNQAIASESVRVDNSKASRSIHGSRGVAVRK
jgi:Peptidase family M23